MSYQRIYKIWKTDISEKQCDEKLTNVDRIIDIIESKQIDHFNEDTMITNINITSDDLRNTNKALQQQLSDTTNSYGAVDCHHRKLKTLQRELSDTQEQLNDVKHTRDEMQIELSDVRGQLNEAQHDNRLLANHAAMAADINNSSERLHDIKSSKQGHHVEEQQQKRKLLMIHGRNMHLPPIIETESIIAPRKVAPDNDLNKQF
ncbi:hypothetical protein ACJMK2_002328 [Sinanodonta woodiana]|uniref:Uncharacterized protein n=1 Tax=Sinanodonta woodiana TaxID=1069815 RepID=A0ABD3XX80_SINWO